ncbi:hypothetical protein B0H19DRAFT_1231908 [Mycena capillaripes]|nr:hypothetical protein B0H19DRAFT_1231908 [Mycena capillaripes]
MCHAFPNRDYSQCDTKCPYRDMTELQVAVNVSVVIRGGEGLEGVLRAASTPPGPPPAFRKELAGHDPILSASANAPILHLVRPDGVGIELQALWTVARFTPHSLFVILTRLPHRPPSIPETAPHRWVAPRACGGNKAIHPPLPLQPCLTCHNWGVHNTFPGHRARGLTGIRAQGGSVVAFMHQQSRGGGADLPGEPHGLWAERAEWTLGGRSRMSFCPRWERKNAKSGVVPGRLREDISSRRTFARTQAPSPWVLLFRQCGPQDAPNVLGVHPPSASAYDGSVPSIKRNAASNPPSRRTAMIDADKNAPDEERGVSPISCRCFGVSEGLTDNPAAEADAKFWAVYMSEAEKYDKSLAENWKSDVGAY